MTTDSAVCKGKFVPLLFELNTIKGYGERVARPVLNLGTRHTQTIFYTSLPLYSWERYPVTFWTRGQM